ncbi:SMEK domain-containing protein [Vreelandella rituensis]|uniref:SMEK domain-containing protein n=1 Tax=Vreelandella rituensis TaxID=2282306 RepID=A0A368UDL6_9GAMM|nr:SMEK domain-containing protein [Halomonas rituensis]RCV93903.1 hypothetical protein DU506_01720 [Halomonas rituensis]
MFGQSNLKAEIDTFCDDLRTYGQRIAQLNSENRTNEALRAEFFYQGVLNSLLGLNLINVNCPSVAPDGSNQGSFAAGIDLLDADAGVAYQITSRQSNRNQKVDEALSKTEAKKRDGVPHYAQVTRLVVLFVGHDNSAPRGWNKTLFKARHAGITLENQTLRNIFELCRRLGLGDEAGRKRLSEAFRFAKWYDKGVSSFTENSYLTKPEKDALGAAKVFRKNVSGLNVSSAFRLRVGEYPHPESRSPPMFNDGFRVLHPRAVNHQSFDAERLRLEGNLVRYWGLDKQYVDNLQHFIRSIPNHKGTNTPDFCDLPDLHVLERSIYQLAVALDKAIGRLRLQQITMPSSSAFYPVICVGQRSTSPWGMSRDAPECQQFALCVNAPDWVWPYTDQKAKEIAEQAQSIEAFNSLIGWLRCVDELVCYLSARVTDHNDLVVGRLKQAEPPEVGIGDFIQ